MEFILGTGGNTNLWSRWTDIYCSAFIWVGLQFLKGSNCLISISLICLILSYARLNFIFILSDFGLGWNTFLRDYFSTIFSFYVWCGDIDKLTRWTTKVGRWSYLSLEIDLTGLLRGIDDLSWTSSLLECFSFGAFMRMAEWVRLLAGWRF